MPDDLSPEDEAELTRMLEQLTAVFEQATKENLQAIEDIKRRTAERSADFERWLLNRWWNGLA